MERNTKVLGGKVDTQISYNRETEDHIEKSDPRVEKDDDHEHLKWLTENNKKTEKPPTNTRAPDREDVHEPPENAHHEAIKSDLSDSGFQAHSPTQQQPQQTLTNSTITDRVTPKGEAKRSFLRNPTAIHPLSDDQKIQNINAPTSVVVLKMRLHCEGCTAKLKKILSKIQGVEKFQIDAAEELIEIEGTMDIKELPIYLTKKLIRKVKVVESHPSDSPLDDQTKITEGNKQDNEVTQLRTGCISKTGDKAAKDSTDFNVQVGQGDTQGHINKIEDAEKIMSSRLAIEHDEKKTGELPPASQEKQLIKHEDLISGNHKKSSANFPRTQFDTPRVPAKSTSPRPSPAAQPISDSYEVDDIPVTT